MHTGWIHVDQHENSRVDTYEVVFDRPAQMANVTKKSKHGTDTRQFITSDPLGPLSGAMMALSQDLTPGKTYAFDVFAGSQRYVFAFDVKERERIHTALGEFDAIKIVPDVWYVSDGKLRRGANRALGNGGQEASAAANPVAGIHRLRVRGFGQGRGRRKDGTWRSPADDRNCHRNRRSGAGKIASRSVILD